MKTSSRIGKIARLPRCVREELNVRIEDGEGAGVLLEWLNSLPVMQGIVRDYFEGRVVTEQNLSVWRQGGFLEWQRNQERRALMLEFLAEGEELEDELQTAEGGRALTDRLAEMVALELAVLLREAMKEECGEKRRKAVLEIARELARLRRGDHRRQEVRLKEERWAKEQEEKFEAELKGMKEEAEAKERYGRVMAELVLEQAEKAQAAGKINAEKVEEVRRQFAECEARLERHRVVEGVPGDNRPVEQRGDGVAMAMNATGGFANPQPTVQGESK